MSVSDLGLNSFIEAVIFGFAFHLGWLAADRLFSVIAAGLARRRG